MLLLLLLLDVASGGSAGAGGRAPRDRSALRLLEIDADVDATRAWRRRHEAGGVGRKALEGNAMNAIIAHAWNGRCGCVGALG